MGTKTVSAPRGTKHVLSQGGKDNSSYSVPKAKEAGGSMSNLGHSLTGASAVQGSDKGK